MTQYQLIDEYFEWLYNTVCKSRYPEEMSFRKLLMFLHDTEFTYFIPKDENRADDGIRLRHRFIRSCGYPDIYEDYLIGPCSVLEMMIALAIICEEHIMDDPAYGDRTSQWFWQMIVSMGLGGMHDEFFDKHKVHNIVMRFLDREYKPDGRGGLFTIRHCEQDLREVEIWVQFCWYLNSIT